MDELRVGSFWNGRHLSRFSQVAFWKVRQFASQFSLWHRVWGWISISMFLATLALLGVLGFQRAMLSVLQTELTNAEGPALPRQSGFDMRSVSLQDPRQETRANLLAFDKQLLANDGVAQAVQDLLRTAEDQGLLIERGDYESQSAFAGDFVRFRMNLPVRGSPQSIQRFIKSALLLQPQLALEGIRFKWEGVEAGDIEAQLGWVLFVPGPATGVSAYIPLSDQGVRP